MVRAFWRSLGAVLTGMIVAVVVVFGVEAVSGQVYPLPPGVDPTDRESLRSAIASLPTGAFVFVLVGWALATLAGTWLAARLAGRSPMLHGIIVAGLLLMAGVANMLTLPHPTWFWLLGVVVFVAGGYAGSKLGAARRAAW